MARTPLNSNNKADMGCEYRFVPLFERVARAPVQLKGEKGEPLLSHARPVPDGLCGEIEVQFEATAPILPGEPDRSSEKLIRPTRLHEDGPYALSGKSGRGMVKSVYRIASFSALSPLNVRHRFGSRHPDYITHRHLTESSVRAGWLQYREGKWWLVPCKRGEYGFDKVKYDEFIAQMQTIKSHGVFSSLLKKVREKECDNKLSNERERGEWKGLPRNEKRRLIREKYDELYPNNPEATDEEFAKAWNLASLSDKFILLHFAFGKIKKICFGKQVICGNKKNAYLVTAGPMSNKLKEAIFPLPEGEGFELDAGVFEDFCFINSKYQRNVRVPDGNWKLLLDEYLATLDEQTSKEICKDLKHKASAPVRDDNPPGIPVYYRGEPEEDAQSVSLGVTQLFKVPYGHTVGEVSARRPEGLESGELDWTQALFGEVEIGEKGSGQALRPAIKGRVSLGFAVALEGTALQMIDDRQQGYKVVQGEPKASYEPFYLSKRNANGGPADYDGDNAVLAGHKRYPARPMELVGQYLGSLRRGRTVPATGMETLVRPLREGVIYRMPIRFHNLHVLELGCLLWSLSFGEAEAFECSGQNGGKYRHMVGRLRNKGLGQLVACHIKFKRVRKNGGGDVADAATLMRGFEIHMGRFIANDEELEEREAIAAFYGSLPIATLLQLVDPDFAKDDKAEMLKLPLKDNGDPDFKKFIDLRRDVYKGGKNGKPASGETTVMDDFFPE